MTKKIKATSRAAFKRAQQAGAEKGRAFDGGGGGGVATGSPPPDPHAAVTRELFAHVPDEPRWSEHPTGRTTSGELVVVSTRLVGSWFLRVEGVPARDAWFFEVRSRCPVARRGAPAVSVRLKVVGRRNAYSSCAAARRAAEQTARAWYAVIDATSVETP